MAGSNDDIPQINGSEGLLVRAAPVLALQLFDYQDASKAIAAANQSTELVAAAASGRAAVFLYHRSANGIWINTFGGPAVADGLGCIFVGPNILFEPNAMRAAINVLTLEANVKITCGVA